MKLRKETQPNLHRLSLGALATWVAGTIGLSTTGFGVGLFDPNMFADLADKVVPAVVNISTFSNVPAMPQNPMDLFRYFFSQPGGGRNGGPRGVPPRGLAPPEGGPIRRQQTALGTGFVIDVSGLILTNNHVVGDADEIKIRFTEDELEKPTEGEVIGRDPDLDLALIKVKTKRKLTAIPLGDSSGLRVGHMVVAVGNPFGRGHSVTQGIISALDRDAENLGIGARYIQTDAAINPGNSGGPLINLDGQVIGINNAIDARAQGIGFAIPVSAVKDVLPQLKKSGRVERGYIGVFIRPLSPELAEQIDAPKDLNAPFVEHVEPGQPAEAAGLQTYDVIVAVNSKKIRTRNELIRAVTKISAGKMAELSILRQGRKKTIKIRVGARPVRGEVAQQSRRKSNPKKKTRVETGMELETLSLSMARRMGLIGKRNGALVTYVAFSSAADQAGVVKGDIIVEVDRKRVKNVSDFDQVVRRKKSYLVRVLRVRPQGEEMFKVVVLDLKK